MLIVWELSRMAGRDGLLHENVHDYKGCQTTSSCMLMSIVHIAQIGTLNSRPVVTAIFDDFLDTNKEVFWHQTISKTHSV